MPDIVNRMSSKDLSRRTPGCSTANSVPYRKVKNRCHDYCCGSVEKTWSFPLRDPRTAHSGISHTLELQDCSISFSSSQLTSSPSFFPSSYVDDCADELLCYLLCQSSRSSLPYHVC